MPLSLVTRFGVLHDVQTCLAQLDHVIDAAIGDAPEHPLRAEIARQRERIAALSDRMQEDMAGRMTARKRVV
jgi:hypothetical protein